MHNAHYTILENLRHDIRAPLTGIIALTKLINGSASAGVLYADALVLATQALLDFQNDMLTATDGASVFDLHRCIYRIINLIRPRAIVKKLLLEVSITDLPDSIISNEKKLSRILLELLTNALKFTDSGKVTLQLSVSDNHRILSIIVSDTGIGIPVDQQDAIFLPGYRLKPSVEGKGLGLAITKRCVEEMLGTVSIESQSGEGTRLICKIPVSVAPIEDYLTSLPTIDLALGAKRLNQAESDAHMMIEKLKESLIATYQEVKITLKNKALERLYAVNHQLLGGLMYCGVPRLEAASRALQGYLTTPFSVEVEKTAEIVLSEIERLMHYS